MGIARKMEGWLDGAVSDQEMAMAIGGRGVVSEFCRVARAVRQVIVLELELTGQRPAPDRDAVREPREEAEEAPERGDDHWRLRDDLNDYDNGPLDQVVAKVRKAVGLEAPADDPFAPEAERRARAELRTSGTGAPSAKTADDGGEAVPAPSSSQPSRAGPLLLPRCGREVGVVAAAGNLARTALLSGVAVAALGGFGRGPPW